MLVGIKRIRIGEMLDGVIGKTIAAELLVISVQYDMISPFRYQEAIVRIGTCRREVEHEDKLSPAEGQYLVAVVVPDFLDRGLVELLLTLDHRQHFSVEIAEIMVARSEEHTSELQSP